jgi:predicted metal-dependent hydrolase
MSTAEITSLAISVLVSLVVALFKHAETQRSLLMERRMDEASAHAKALETVYQGIETRTRANELQNMQLEGELKLLLQNHDHLDGALSEIKDAIVPRREWESRMLALEKGLAQIHSVLASLSMPHGRKFSPPST